MNIFARSTFLMLSLSLLLAGCSEGQTKKEQPSQPSRADGIEWYGIDQAEELATTDDRTVLVYAEADWCPYCKQMENEVFTLEKVQELTNTHFYPVRLDIDSQDSLNFRGEKFTERELSAMLRVSGTPTFVFFNEKGEVIANQAGFIPAEIYTQMLKYVGNEVYEEQTFEEFQKKEGE